MGNSDGDEHVVVLPGNTTPYFIIGGRSMALLTSCGSLRNAAMAVICDHKLLLRQAPGSVFTKPIS